MKIKNIFLCLLAFLALAATAQPVQQKPEWEWYLDEVVDDVFVGRNYFEYYYTPSAADMRQQRDRGEVTFFLNSPAGLNVKKVRDMVDRLMASYDDIQAMNEWQTTSTTIWKEFRYEKNKFRFSIKRKALDDGTYYVSVTETAGYYKSLGKQDKQQEKQQEKKQEKQRPQATERTEASDKPTRRSSRDRKPVVIPNNDQEQAEQTEQADEAVMTDESPAEITAPAMDEKERRRIAREREQAQEQEQRLAQRRAREEQKAKEKALKEAEKQRKAEEKKQKEEEKRLKKEEEKRQREQERLARQEEQEHEQRRQARRQADTPKATESHYHVDDIALWLSEKYDFTQIGGDGMSCTMYSNAVKDTDMAKLAVKNALKGSNARMAVPWRVNGTTGAVETGYTVDNHVLVFAIGKDSDDRITVTVTEVSQDQFEQFKQSINN